jgi:hypothetical protein
VSLRATLRVRAGLFVVVLVAALGSLCRRGRCVLASRAAIPLAGRCGPEVGGGGGVPGCPGCSTDLWALFIQSPFSRGVLPTRGRRQGHGARRAVSVRRGSGCVQPRGRLVWRHLRLPGAGKQVNRWRERKHAFASAALIRTRTDYAINVKFATRPPSIVAGEFVYRLVTALILPTIPDVTVALFVRSRA